VLFSTSAMAKSFVWHNRKFNEIWFHGAVSGSPANYISVNVNSIMTDRPIWAPGTMSRDVMYQGLSSCFGASWLDTQDLHT
jgi:hypothetical protein